MSWIKRNLFFVIGSAVALVLMGLAGWFLYSSWNLNNQMKSAVSTKLEEWNKLNKERPHPGVGPVNNISNAVDQTRQLREFVAKTRACFSPIAAIPNTPQVEDQAFSRGLSSTIKGLQDLAARNSVSLPPGYYFSFEAMKTKVNFASGSLVRVAAQLGEVKEISEVLLQSRINSLTSLRRERVSADDASGPQTDYLSDKTVTNDLAIVTPFEVTFTCFSAELGAVLSAFATSPHGFIVRTIDVTAAPAAETADATTPATPGTPPPPPVDLSSVYPSRRAFLSAQPAPPPTTPAASPAGAGAVRQPPVPVPNPGARPALPNQPTTPTTRGPSTAPGTTAQPRPGYPQPGYPQPGYPPPAPPEPPKPSMQIALDEKLLTVTIGLNVVKLLPPK
jgi:hypothetical protein